MEKQNQVKVYLDEDVRPLLAQVLKQRAYDVISCLVVNSVGLSDEEQLKQAINLERAILTHNIRDFVKLHKKYYQSHYGILLSEQVQFRTLLRRMLKFLSRFSSEKIKGQIIWLSSFD